MNFQIPHLPDFVYLKLFKTGATFLVGIILILLINKGLEIFFNGVENKSRLASYKKRMDTFRNLISNMVKVVLFAIIILIVVKDMGVDVTPLLTGAGILGLAISFGSQTLFKDLISGFFIIGENQYNVGDLVKIGEDEGTVIKINLRTTILRDKKGNTIYIPNSSITRVMVMERKSKIITG